MAMAAPELLSSLLKQVSRSFYLTLRVLPKTVRSQIGLAYLLARATDTIADTEMLPVATRLASLNALRQRILDETSVTLRLADLFSDPTNAGMTANGADLQPGSGSSAEGLLLGRVEEALSLLRSFSASDQQRIRQVLATITSGQILDLERFAEASATDIRSLETDQQLDDYTYRVAGCVGEFWTAICRAHIFPAATLDDNWLMVQGVRFGKGLQLVNVLRDLPADLRQGRCYMPAEELERVGLTPPALLNPSNEPGFRPLYERYLAQAQAHLTAGWAYTEALPRRAVRVRLACAWPLLIGVRTLQRLHLSPVLDFRNRIKIGRIEVRNLVLRSVLYYPWPKAWNRLFDCRRTGVFEHKS